MMLSFQTSRRNKTAISSLIKMAVFWIRGLENDEWIGPTPQFVKFLILGTIKI